MSTDGSGLSDMALTQVGSPDSNPRRCLTRVKSTQGSGDIDAFAALIEHSLRLKREQLKQAETHVKILRADIERLQGYKRPREDA